MQQCHSDLYYSKGGHSLSHMCVSPPQQSQRTPSSRESCCVGSHVSPDPAQTCPDYSFLQRHSPGYSLPTNQVRRSYYQPCRTHLSLSRSSHQVGFGGHKQYNYANGHRLGASQPWVSPWVPSSTAS